MTFYDFVESSDTTREKFEILQLFLMLPEFDSLDTPENLCTQIEKRVHELLEEARKQYKRTEW